MSSQTPTDHTEITSLDQLTSWMEAGAKPAERWVVGTEHEKIGWWPDGRYPTYEGDNGIGALFERLAAEAGWVATREGSDIIALARGRATLTLEPGGQLELSGAPLRTLAETAAELDAHFAEIRAYSEPLGLSWSNLGVAPRGAPADMPKMPKARYGVMRRYLATRGDLALHMMHLSSTVQANFDFADGRDAMRKLRASLMLQPLVYALFANSTVMGGELLPQRSMRAEIWLRTDPDRCRFPDRFLERGASLEDYVNWALDVPMFFVHRDDLYIDCAGLPFRQFLDEGLRVWRPTVGDFALHLSTLFPDARLKQHLEVRAGDMGDRAHILALPALHVGLLYDSAAFSDLLALFDGTTPAEWWAAREAVAVEGLGTRMGNRTLHELGHEVLALATAGLDRWEPDAAPMLDPLRQTLETGETQADRIRATWDGDALALLRATRVC